MSNSVVTHHDNNSAMWLDLNPGQVYRLRVHLWEGNMNAKAKSEGTLIFTYGHFNAQFADRGGVAAALNGVSIDIDTDEECDIKLVATTQRAIHLELSLQALNGVTVGGVYKKQLAKSGKSKIRLTLEYAFEV